MTNHNFIGGQWVPALDGATFERRNPADTTDLVGTYPQSGTADVSAAVAGVQAGYREWADTSPERRAAVLEAAGEWITAHGDELAIELVREEGKTLAEARMEVSRTPLNLRFYAGEAFRTHRADVTRPPTAAWSSRCAAPVGVVAAITPWNFPLNIPSRKLGPALAAGNGVVFKPSRGDAADGPAPRRGAAGRPDCPRAPSRSCRAVAPSRRGARRRPAGRRSHVHRVDAVGKAIHAAAGPTVAPSWRWAARTRSSSLADADLDAGGADHREGRVRPVGSGLHRNQPGGRPRRGPRRAPRAAGRSWPTSGSWAAA